MVRVLVAPELVLPVEELLELELDELLLDELEDELEEDTPLLELELDELLLDELDDDELEDVLPLLELDEDELLLDEDELELPPLGPTTVSAATTARPVPFPQKPKVAVPPLAAMFVL